MTPYFGRGRSVGSICQENGRVMLEWRMIWGATLDQAGADFEAGFQTAMVAFVKFWCHPSRRHLVDDDLCKICFADTVDFLLVGDPLHAETMARAYVGFCINFKEMVKKGVDTWLDEVTRHGQSKENIETVRKLQTREGLINYLANGIPCSCLDEVKKTAKADGPKNGGVCDFCKKEEIIVKLSRCSRCKYVQYCSKECQKAHWKQHKAECSFRKGKMEQE